MAGEMTAASTEEFDGKQANLVEARHRPGATARPNTVPAAWNEHIRTCRVAACSARS